MTPAPTPAPGLSFAEYLGWLRTYVGAGAAAALAATALKRRWCRIRNRGPPPCAFDEEFYCGFWSRVIAAAVCAPWLVCCPLDRRADVLAARERRKNMSRKGAVPSADAVVSDGSPPAKSNRRVFKDKSFRYLTEEQPEWPAVV